jgi:DNA-binding protein H-NS
MISAAPPAFRPLEYTAILIFSFGGYQMPRPTNLSAMSVDALLKLRGDIDRVLSRKANELRSQLSMLGVASVRRKQAGPLKGRKVPPKYRSPSGETWAGRGARPRWLVAALKKGKKVENFLIKRPKR